MDIKPKHEPNRPEDHLASNANLMIPTPGNTHNVVYNHTLSGYTYNAFYNGPDNNNGVYNDVVNNKVNNNIIPTGVELTADISKEDEAYLKTFPAGYRFNPHDDELIRFYLKPKVENKYLPPNKIRSVDLYLYHPQVLIEAISDKHTSENAWYFFTPRNRKYPNGTRPNRAAGKSGYWKATGADKSIEHGAENTVVGYRKALVFYEGSPPNGLKTNWIMHEYRVNQPPRNKINANDMKLDDWVLCKLHKKVDRSVKIARGDAKSDGDLAWEDGEPQLGIVDDANLLLPHGNNNMNPNINADIDSNALLFHPSTYLSYFGVDDPFVNMIDPRITSNQNALQNGLWNTNNTLQNGHGKRTRE